MTPETCNKIQELVIAETPQDKGDVSLPQWALVPIVFGFVVLLVFVATVSGLLGKKKQRQII